MSSDKKTIDTKWKYLSYLAAVAIMAFAVGGVAATTFFFGVQFGAELGAPVGLTSICASAVALLMFVAYSLSWGVGFFSIVYDHFNPTKTEKKDSEVQGDKISSTKKIFIGILTCLMAGILAIVSYLGYVQLALTYHWSALTLKVIGSITAVCTWFILSLFLYQISITNLMNKSELSTKPADSNLIYRFRYLIGGVILTAGSIVGLALAKGYTGMKEFLLLLGFSSASFWLLALVGISILILLAGGLVSSLAVWDKFKDWHGLKPDSKRKVPVLYSEKHPFLEALVIIPSTAFNAVLPLVPVISLIQALGLSILSPLGLSLLIIVGGICVTGHVLTYRLSNGTFITDNWDWLESRLFMDFINDNWDWLKHRFLPTETMWKDEDVSFFKHDEDMSFLGDRDNLFLEHIEYKRAETSAETERPTPK